MKLTVGFQQALVVISMIAVQTDSRPLKIATIARQMRMPESYLRKLASKLVHQGILKSVATSKGGYSLAKSLDEVTLADVFSAIEGEAPFLQTSPVVERSFTKPDIYNPMIDDVVLQLMLAEIDYRNRLKEFPLSRLIPTDQHGKMEQMDWQKLNLEMD